MTKVEGIDRGDLDRWLGLLGGVEDLLLEGLLLLGDNGHGHDETRISTTHSFRVRCGAGPGPPAFPGAGAPTTATARSRRACLEECERGAVARARAGLLAECVGAAHNPALDAENCRFWTAAPPGHRGDADADADADDRDGGFLPVGDGRALGHGTWNVVYM